MNALILFVLPEKWRVDEWARTVKAYNFQEGYNYSTSAVDWVSVYPGHKFLEDYEPDELQVLADLIKEPTVNLVEWRGEVALSELFCSLDKSSVIDNDHGSILAVDEIEKVGLFEWINMKPH